MTSHSLAISTDLAIPAIGSFIPMDLPSLFIGSGDAAKRFPDAVSLLVLSHLSFAMLAANCNVSKKWNALAKNPLLLKKIMYRDLVFGNAQWARCFNQEMLKDEDYLEEYRSLPDDIGAIYKKNHIKPVRMPKTLNGGLTLRALGVLAKKYFPENENGYRLISDEIMKEHGDKSIEQSRWVLMGDILPSSFKKNYVGQLALVAEHARVSQVTCVVPRVLTVALCVLAQYFSSSLLSKDPSSYTRICGGGSYISCQEKIKDLQVIVGGFLDTGLCIKKYTSSGSENVGITVIQEFYIRDVIPSLT